MTTRYVEMLEQQQLQLVNGLQELYKRSVSGRTWTGPVLQDPGNGRPLTHDILETLGVLKQRTRSKLGSFEEDLDVMQRKLVTGGASFEHHRGSPDTEPDTSPIQVSPIQMSFLESIPQKQMFTDPFNSSQMPTPPLESPQRRLSHEDAQIHSGAASYTGPQRLTSMNPGMIQHRQSWVPCPAVYSDGMDFQPFDTSLDFANIKSEQQLRPVSISEASSGLAFPDWSEDDFGKFLNPTLT